uniref:Uncharacterized protein n=1 Tax=Populus alba TaxID=43335 RepID=A0A4U5P572_POPAL|nr:hypothetical protein D5086_0000230040 [Populus alba]
MSAVFHPTRSIFFVSTKKNVRVYDLLKQKLIKKLETGLREVSSISVHPTGDNVIVGSRDGKLCWFDMDLSSKPYKVLKCHPKDITNVAFHRSYPLFASCSDDCTAYVFHGMVYSDLNQNPLIVPLEILRGHASSNGRAIIVSPALRWGKKSYILLEVVARGSFVVKSSVAEYWTASSTHGNRGYSLPVLIL